MYKKSKNWFLNLSLSQKITITNSIIFFIATLLALSLFSYSTYTNGLKVQSKTAVESFKIVESVKSDFFQSILTDIQLLKNSKAISDFKTQVFNNNIKKNTILQIEQTLSHLIKAKPYYQEARIIKIDEKGKELVRINNYNGIKIIRGTDLQEKSHRDYYKNAMNTPFDQTYIGKITLRRESYFKGPQKDTPQVRFLKAISFNDKPVFFLTLNVNFNYFTDMLKQRFGDSHRIILYNKEGHYIFDSKKELKNLFGFEFNRDPLLNLDFPQLKISSDQSQFQKGRIIYTNKYFEKNGAPSFGLIFSFKKSTAMTETIQVMKNSVIIFTMANLVILLLSFLYSRNLLNPIKQLASLAKLPEEFLSRFAKQGSFRGEIGEISTALVKYIEETKKNEQFIKSLFEKSKDGFCVINGRGQIVLVNKSLCEIFGYTRDELIHKDIGILMPEEHAKNHQSYINNYFITQKKHALLMGRELVAKRKDGSKVEIFLNVAEIYNDQSGCSNFLGIVKDIHQIKKIESSLKLEIENNITESRFNTLGKLASGIAHEINSPLQNLVLTTEYMEHLIKAQKTEELESEFNHINEDVDRITKIIDTMKSLSRASKGSERTKCNLNDLILETKSLYRKKLILYGISLNFHLDQSTQAKIFCNKVEIQQILLNLINNSIDALIDHEKNNKTIDIITEINDNSLEVYVCDSGPGLTKDLQERIFDPLFTTKEVGQGSGLGLSISSAIAKKNNLELSFVESIPNKLTKFSLCFNQWERNIHES